MAGLGTVGKRAAAVGHIGFLESNLSGSGFEALRVAKRLVGRVTFLTRDLDRYLEVPGAPEYFDEFVDDIVYCETNELEDVIAAVREVQRRQPLDAFLTMGEYDVVVAAEVARRLGLPGVTPAAVAAARNKLCMRQRCAEAGVPVPKFWSVSSVSEVPAALDSVRLPCVVKPVDETSSAGVARCADIESVERHVQTLLARTENTRGQRPCPNVLIEECLHGHEVSVEVVCEGERWHVLGVTDKSLGGSDRFVETAHAFPSMLPDAVRRDCADVAVQALQAVGFDLGIAHVEVKVTERGPFLVEINPRPAGGRITDLVDYALGRSCLELMLKQYLGQRVLEHPIGGACRGAAIRYLTANPGRVVDVRGMQVACCMPGIRDVVVKAHVGDTVHKLQRNGDRLGHVLAVASTPYEASRWAEAAAHEIVIRTEREE